MKYIVLDGYISGTGTRDTMQQLYIPISELNLGEELTSAIKSWKSKYYNATVNKEGETSYQDFCNLDKQGIELSKIILELKMDYKIDYYFSDYLSKRVYPFEWNDFLLNRFDQDYLF